MKLIHSIPLIIATACLAITGCDKKTGADSGTPPAKPVDEKTAIANFKADIESAGKWIEGKKPAMNDPETGAAAIGEVIAKLKGLKTDGLPADLKSAWGEMNGALTEMGEVFKGMPKIDKSKPEEMNKAMEDFMPKMIAVSVKIDPIAKKLDEVGKKYGLNMKKVMPGGKNGDDKPEGDELPKKADEPAK